MATPVLEQQLTLSLCPGLSPGSSAGLGFSARPARLALCRELSAGIMAPNPGGELTPYDLDRHQISLHQAWNIAATNLIAAARTPEGIRFYTRPSPVAGLEVAGHGSPIGAWLAHPWPLNILYEHLCELLGEECQLWVSGVTSLLATPTQLSSAQHKALLSRVTHGSPRGCFQVRRGFPVPVD